MSVSFNAIVKLKVLLKVSWKYVFKTVIYISDFKFNEETEKYFHQRQSKKALQQKFNQRFSKRNETKPKP